MKNCLWIGVLTTGCLLGVSVQAALLVNGDFEDGDTGQLGSTPIPGWSSWGSSGWHHNDAGKIIDTKAMKTWWVDSGLYQDFSAIAGETYTFSGFLAHFSDDALRDGNEGPGTGDKRGLLKAEWYLPTFGAPLRVDTFAILTKDSTQDVWIPFSADLVAPVGATIGRMVLASDISVGGAGSPHYDNVSVVQVPEPTSLALLGLGVLMVLRRFRR